MACRTAFAVHVAPVCLLLLVLCARASSAAVFDVRTFGAVGDGVTLDTDALERALAAAAADAPDAWPTVKFSAPGEYLTAPLNLTAAARAAAGRGACDQGREESDASARIKT